MENSLQKIEKREITEELRESYLDYAMSVIVSRALPDVRDGLKPVQRRILWAMWETGLKAGVKYRKSAAVVGEVLKSYHPHGDLAVYDALARMAQDFSLRYPLIDGQGNWGCFTKDTKVKLTDGRDLSFEDLIKEEKEGNKNYTYTVNSLGLISIAEIKNSRLTKKNTHIIKVILDNGQEIKCTPNHLFMLKDGSYKEAKDLTPHDSLMPYYQKLSEKADRLNREGYVLIYQPKKNEWIPTHHLADNFNLTNKKYLKSKGKVRHHIDLIRQEINQNHKIIKIENLPEVADVYDLTIDGTHNFCLGAGIFVHNSIDGDNQAAMRYTECRLSKISEELLFDIEKETVNWQPNYDASVQEPKVLPAKLPNLLLNGVSGIAVGMATSIPPHNLGEVVDATLYLIEKPKASVENLLEFIKGPDFPTGGIIYDRKAIIDAYSSGRGPITCRAKTEIQERAKNQFNIIITEIPYQVNKAELIVKIANLAQEKKVEGIRDLRDESDREGLRIVVELKADASAQKVLNQLFQYTDLQKNFNLNMIALVNGIQPQILSLKEILEYYLEHRKEIVRRRAEFDLKKARERAHILEGLAKALSVIDKIIETIKKSKDRDAARGNLMAKFKLTEIQANAILEMKLATLAALEREKIENELAEKKKLIKELEILLKSPEKILKIIKDELIGLKEKFKDNRRTQFTVSGLKEFKEEDLVPLEEAIIAMTSDGYIKRMLPGTFKIQKRGGKGLIGSEVGEEDSLSHFISAGTHDNILFFTDKGRAFQTKVYEIPVGSRTAKGKLIQNFLEIPGEENVSATISYPSQSKDFLVMATKNGVIKKTGLEEFENVRRTGIIAIGLKGGDSLKWAKLSSGKDEIILATANGQAIRFKESQLRPMGRTAAGVRAIRLKKGDCVASMDIIKENQKNDKSAKALVVMENGFAKQTLLQEYKTQSRGGSGIKTAKINSKTGKAVAIEILSGEEELLALSAKGQIIKTKISDIRVSGRATSGVKIMRLNEGDKVAGIVVL